ncbi:MAG: hypothetical protein Ct9H300mP1_01700 [Planctomycetaceae bacterium]|nr:MAG: hypothetical protein Ct9H300mP1_01700 [Planctomycetaceae bacterium]
MGDWKAVVKPFHGTKVELYHLGKDLGEKTTWLRITPTLWPVPERPSRTHIARHHCGKSVAGQPEKKNAKKKQRDE